MKHILTGSNLIGAFALLALALGCANTQCLVFMVFGQRFQEGSSPK
jgi:hypothetical protein